MRRPDRSLQELARRAIKTRLAGPATSAAAAQAMQGSCGDLYRVLETVMGPAGLQALIGRAIQLTARDHPWLARVTPGTAVDCALSGLTEAAGPLDADDASEGCTALLASILWLLITFIGEDLTFRFVRHAWPDVSLSNLPEGSSE